MFLDFESVTYTWIIILILSFAEKLTRHFENFRVLKLLI